VAFFYEIRNSEDAVLKRIGGFATQDLAKAAAREDAKKMKSAPYAARPEIGRVLVGQNTDKSTKVLAPESTHCER
jgi:hypothetical protein